MKPPVEYVKVSARGKETLIKIKRLTGLEHWNEICRIALCRSLANPTPPPKADRPGDSSIIIEWKTFAGPLQEELAALTTFRAVTDGIDVNKREALTDYFRAHLERGLTSLQNVKNLIGLYDYKGLFAKSQICCK
jgi:DNA sulfur modification protein DndE